jgi:membrane protein YqaA with SNARE-associated domain
MTSPTLPENASPSNERDSISRSDQLVTGRAALATAFAWGLAEAIFFFIVPDVLLTLIATRSLRSAMKATIAALAGALVGGVLVVVFAHASPDAARAYLLHIPGINAHLLERVAGQVDERGLLAVLIGPLKGIPYKIYAVEWGTRGGALFSFLLISIPARWLRFALAAVVTRVIVRLIEPLTHHRASIEWLLLAVIWTAFYTFYFARFGW